MLRLVWYSVVSIGGHVLLIAPVVSDFVVEGRVCLHVVVTGRSATLRSRNAL